MSDLKNLVTNMEELTEALKEGISLLSKDGDDKVLATMQGNFDKLMETVLKFKQVDLTPISHVISDISKQNVSMLDTLGRLVHSSNNEKLISLVTETVNRSNELIEQAFKHPDYSQELKNIAAALKKEDREVLRFEVERNGGGFIERVIPIYKTNK